MKNDTLEFGINMHQLQNSILIWNLEIKFWHLVQDIPLEHILLKEASIHRYINNSCEFPTTNTDKIPECTQ